MSSTSVPVAKRHRSAILVDCWALRDEAEFYGCCLNAAWRTTKPTQKRTLGLAQPILLKSEPKNPFQNHPLASKRDFSPFVLPLTPDSDMFIALLWKIPAGYGA
jgi:hypothetical protein